ncbi:MAG: hypothetical protein U1A78_39430 [Polyangia bacterium]
MTQPRADTQDKTQVLTGVVELPPPAPLGKRFRGALLHPATGPAWVLTYVADELWAAFAGRRITVTGVPHYPEGQALVAPHLRPVSWRIEQPGPEDSIVEVGPEQRLRGVFERQAQPAGSKLAGELVTRFVADGGGSFLLSHAPEPLPLGRPVELRARPVEPSPVVARMGGPYLWVFEITER